MSDLPPGWEWTTIGEVGEVMLGRQRSPKWHNGPNMRPYLRVANVYEDRIDLSDVKEMDFPPDQFERYKLEPGDILLNEGQSPEWVGRPAMYRGELPGACFTNSLIRFRPLPGVDGRYALYLFRHHLHSRRFMREARITTNIAHLSSKRFTSVEFPLPPVAEQKRIVAAIEEHLSRLDAAEAAVASARVRLKQMAAKVKEAVLVTAPVVSLADLKLDARYGTSVKCTYAAQGPGVIRIPNIVDEHVLVNDLKFATDPSGVSPEVLLAHGDVVFIRTNGSRDIIGRAAVASGDAVGLGFASYLIRYRVRADVDPKYLCAVVSAPSTRRILERLASTTAGQFNLSVSKLDSLSVPLPPLDEQRRLLNMRSGRLSGISRLTDELSAAEARVAGLRRSILAAAFSGQLVPQDHNDEPASVLLDRIRAERAATSPVRRSRKAATA